MERDRIKEAIRNVVDEGVGEDGLAIEVHCRRDPGKERMQKLISSLEFLSENLPPSEPLERDFANALHGLTFHLSHDLSLLLKSSNNLYVNLELRDEFLKTELPHVIIFADLIFDVGEPRGDESAEL